MFTCGIMDVCLKIVYCLTFGRARAYLRSWSLVNGDHNHLFLLTVNALISKYAMSIVNQHFFVKHDSFPQLFSIIYLFTNNRNTRPVFFIWPQLFYGMFSLLHSSFSCLAQTSLWLFHLNSKKQPISEEYF